MPTPFWRGVTIGLLSAVAIASVDPPVATRPDTSPGDRMLADYFRNETATIARQCLADVKTLDDWNARREEYRRELAEMLGLWPMPARTDLKATVTGKIDHPEFTVEKLYFQSSPRLYVAGNLYVPKGLTRPAPAILYVCGHSEVKKNGVSYGNKAAYQHHGAWFGRNGYVCLVIDTLQLGEIEGIHHGTYREGMWWWHSRGYTPAGVEAWNGIRALDYLCSRPEVDASRIGMTGRSGGGAYTWWVAALDDRVKVACPVAGITDLQNHVVDGCIEGHCDCMYMVNTYRWDFAQVAALVAPRPLLIGNSDKDTIFPLDGVYRLHEQVRRIYKLNGADKNLGLLITEGPHEDTQDLQVPVFRWFNRFLKGENRPVEKVATNYFEPQQLRVFDRLPEDQMNTTIQETFVPVAEPPGVPESAGAWAMQRDKWMTALKEKTFRGWPDSPPPLDVHQTFSVARDGLRFAAYNFTSQHDTPLRLFILDAENGAPEQTVLSVLDDQSWMRWLARMRVSFENQVRDEPLPSPDESGFAEWSRTLKDEKTALAWVAPRGVGPTAWTADINKRTHIRRRFALLGQTLDGMRAWDVRRAVQVVRSVRGLETLPLTLRGEGSLAGVVLYASLFEPRIAGLDLWKLPPSHRDGPDLLNVLQTLDIPAAVALAAERCSVHISASGSSEWDYPIKVVKKLGWSADRLQITDGAESARPRE